MNEISEWLINKGIEQGEMNKARKLAIKMYRDGSEPSYIADFLDVSEKLVEEWVSVGMA